ncbi:FHA domain-containing protein [Serinibacter salmoneus]|uniref:FHA domain-containing protein n=1 Tax=Serinibacter salmoneus TaxID=556530 RepID=A0A2A9D3P9_9MICO|nr:FHA domain-containing protein [Serinibacter salmoneus]
MAASVVIDAALVLGLAAGAGLLAASGYGPRAAWVSACAIAASCLGAWWWDRATMGTSPGHAALGLRTVAAADRMPSHPLRGQRLTLDIGTGADPLRLRARPIHLDPPARRQRRSDRAEVRLVFEDGTRVEGRGTFVLGRAPKPQRHGDATMAVPDLTRSLAPSHAVLRVDGRGVTVTDLGSAHGTIVVDAAGRRALQPHLPTHVPWNSTLTLGERSALLERRDPIEARE